MHRNAPSEVKTVEGYMAAVALLPPELSVVLQRVPSEIAEQTREIRLRNGRAVALGMGDAEWCVCADGTLSQAEDKGVMCTSSLLQMTVQRLSRYSLYSHTEELRHGFLTANGCRVGIAGTAIVNHGEIVSYRSIDALCLRVARMHHGCAATLAQRLCADGAVRGALICGEPSSGKTSILRDLAVQLVQRRLSVTVIDERGELDGVQPLLGCDVLRYAPKAVGIEQAVRCLAPHAVLVDELGDTTDLEAVRNGSLRGVPTIATVHGRSVQEVCRRSELYRALQDGVFDYVVLMQGRTRPGHMAHILRTEEL